MTTKIVIVNVGPASIEVVPTHEDSKRRIYATPIRIDAGGTLTEKYVFPGQEFLVREVFP